MFMQYNKLMQIIDNFLDENTFNFIYHSIYSSSFPWYLSGIIKADLTDENGIELFHTFYDNHSINSQEWATVLPIIDKINPRALVRVRANLMPKNDQNTEFGWHTDFNFDCTTAIFYLNSNDGYTLFEDGTKVESVANRFVSFNSLRRHTGVHPTNTQFRCFINFNYL